MFVITKNHTINLDKVCFIKKDTENKALDFYFDTYKAITVYCSNLEKAYQDIQNCICYRNSSVYIAEFEE